MSLRLYASKLAHSNTHDFWIYVTHHCVNEIHIDNRAIDEVCGQTVSLVTLSLFGFLSPHSEGAIYFIFRANFTAIGRQGDDDDDEWTDIWFSVAAQ